jgi:hypothetical protein
MKHLFIPKRLAEQAFDKGFNEICIGYYLISNVALINRHKHVPKTCTFAPLYQQMMSWFKEHHDLKIEILHSDGTGLYKFGFWKSNRDNDIGKWERMGYIGLYYTWNDAADKAIQEALNLIEDDRKRNI